MTRPQADSKRRFDQLLQAMVTQAGVVRAGAAAPGRASKFRKCAQTGFQNFLTHAAVFRRLKPPNLSVSDCERLDAACRLFCRICLNWQCRPFVCSRRIQGRAYDAADPVNNRRRTIHVTMD